MYTSVLVAYQIMEDVGQPLILKEFHRYLGYDTSRTPERYVISFYFTRFTGEIRSYQYTIQTYYGFGIKAVLDIFSETDRIIVSWYDGPLLVNSFTKTEHYVRGYKGHEVTGGFIVRFLLKLPRSNIDGNCSIIYRKYRHTYTYFKLTNVEETYNISVNTMRTIKGTPFYYKYIAIAAHDGFIKLTVRNIRTLSGGSYRCEFGGFVISNLWIHHLNVIGPYCTQYGTEPLVNDVNTFYSSKSYITFLVYSYAFILDIDISFQQTPCEGITNVCSLYCWAKGFPNNQPKNHEILDHQQPNYCKLTIIIKKHCVVVQRTAASEPFLCWIHIMAKGGHMDAIFQTQNKFR